VISTAAILDLAAAISGMAAALIAIGGFLAHLRPALSGADEERLRQVTVKGGAAGLIGAILVIVLSAFLD
jgi:amino acid transporter